MPSKKTPPDDNATRSPEALQARCRALEAALARMEQRNRLLGDSAPFGIFAMKEDGRIGGYNNKMRALLGWPATPDPPELNALERPEFATAGISDDLRLCLKTGRTIIKTHACFNHEEACLQLRFHMSPVLNAAGQAEGAIVFVEDFSHVQQAAEAVRESDQRYQVLFHSAPVAMIERDASRLKDYLAALRQRGVTDLADYLDRYPDEVRRCMQLVQTIDFNKAMLELMDADDRQSLSFGPPWSDSEEFRAMAREVILMIAGGDIGRERERVITSLKGRRKTVLTKALAVSGHEDTLARLIITLIDISERKAAEEALRESEHRFRQMALRDTLTGLYNRRFLYQKLPEMIASGRHDETGMALVFMDLDNFKQVVDTYGHLNGSQVIKEVAAVIEKTLAPPAFAVAYAGDEFVVVYPDCNLAGAMEKAQAIRQRICRAVYLSEKGQAVKVQVSLGVAAYPSQARDAEELLSFADNALFAMKARGKNGVRAHR